MPVINIPERLRSMSHDMNKLIGTEILALCIKKITVSSDVSSHSQVKCLVSRLVINTDNHLDNQNFKLHNLLRIHM